MEETTGLNAAIASSDDNLGGSDDDLDAEEDETTKTHKKGKVTITAHATHDDRKDKVDKREMDYTVSNDLWYNIDGDVSFESLIMFQVLDDEGVTLLHYFPRKSLGSSECGIGVLCIHMSTIMCVWLLKVSPWTYFALYHV